MPAWSGAIVLNPMVRDQRGPLEPIGCLEMSRDLSRVLANIRDSERVAEAWPEALKSITEALGAGGRLHRRQQELK